MRPPLSLAVALGSALGFSVFAGASACGGGCHAPSSDVDGGDLMGVFDHDGGRADGGIVAIESPSASASAAASAHSKKHDAGPPPIASVVRKPDGPSCVTPGGEAADAPLRIVGRPACRNAEVLEWRDPQGEPRYACAVSPPDMEKRQPLPLVVYFHGETPGLDDPANSSKLTSLREDSARVDLGEGAGHEGFVLLEVQGRAIGHGKLGGATFDATFTGPDNVDVITTDHFADTIIARGSIDKRRIYAVGSGRGGMMAATYAMLRADRIAAFGSYAAPPPTAAWSCPGPPPPAVVFYRSCDSIASCDDIESWLLRRDKSRADTLAVRLGEANETDSNCAVDQCSKKRGEMNHAHWPKGREKDLFRFLAAHSLASEP